MQGRRFCDLWDWLVFVIYGLGLCCLCIVFEEIYGMKMKIMKRDEIIFVLMICGFGLTFVLVCVMCLKKFNVENI